MKNFENILIFGCGNMGGAMLAGWLASGMEPSQFTVADPELPKAPRGVALSRTVPDGPFDAVLLGVKPQMLEYVVPNLAPLVGTKTILLSVLAGVELASLSARFPTARGVVRIMPNLAAAIGKSPMALASRGLDTSGMADVHGLLAPLGTPEWIDESLFDAVTALAGSGPAFVYRFIDALAAGATALGLHAVQAQRLALATVEGASALASASEHPPGELARRVASPGGTTEAGLRVLDADGALERLVAATLKAAADRSAEMAAAARS